MSLKSSLVAGFLSTAIAVTTLSAGAKAQGGVNRVISWVENEVNHSLILHTGSSSPMSAPQIQYLPGSDGKTVMVADFYGLSWIEASKIIRPAPSGTFASIEEVRIGQFQANPPICRVALSTKNPACLKEVSFSSKPGQLVIKWQVAALAQGTSVHQIHTRIPAQTRQTASELGVHQMHTTVPAPAPAAVAQADWQAMPGRKATNQLPASAIRTMSTLPPDAVRTDDQRIDDLINTARRSTIKSGNKSPLHTGNQMPLPAPDIAARSQPDNSEADASGNSDTARTNADRERESDDGSLPGPPMARLTIINGKNANDPQATIQILTEKHITFKSFRMHNPERHVIDLEKPEEFDEATVSAFENNAFLKTVRIGEPDKKTCRIVLDLADENVGVAEQTYLGDDKLLTITLSPQAPQTPQTQADTSASGSATIVLDAGHGGSDPGAQRGDIQEKAMTLAIVKQLQKRLEGSGLHVIMTRSDDTFVSLEDRVKLTNNVMPSAFVSVHINALESTSDIHGIETYFLTEQSKTLAETIHSNLVNLLAVPDRGIRKARFYVIHHTPVPAILAEVGFISNKDEREKLNSSDYQGKVADALAQGVMLYLGKGSLTQTTTTHSVLAVSDRKPAKKGTTTKGNKSVASGISQSNARQVSR